MSVTTKAIMLLVTVFLAGATFGLVIADHVEEWNIPGLPQDSPDYDDDLEEIIDAEAEMMTRLWLNAEQRRRIDAILKAREDSLVSYWSLRIPDMQAIIDSARMQIRRELQPDQLARYEDELLKLRRSRVTAQSH